MKTLSKKYITALVCLIIIMLSCCIYSAAACEHLNTVAVLGKEASCTQTGYTDGVYCNDCESYVSGHEEISAAHIEISFRRVEPTCISVGYTAGIYCSQCESFLSGHEEIPFAEHMTEFREGYESTCYESGYTDGYICTVCEEWISGHTVIPAAHKESVIPKVPESCTENGYTEGVYCSECEVILSGREIIPAGHREVYVSEEPATCTGNGYTGGTFCTVCNVYTSGHVEIPFTDHTFTEKIIDQRHLVSYATVESPAIYRYDCATCSAISPNLTFTYGSRLTVGATGQIKAVQNSSAIKIQWSSVIGATGYRIYYYNGKLWQAVRDVKALSVTFTGLKSGTVYKFAVRAFAEDEGKINLSHDYTTIETATQTAAPAKIVAKQNTNAIRLQWTPVANASGYRIYYRSGGSSWKTCVKSTVETSYTFTNLPSGRTYEFAVRPYIVYNGGFVLGEYRTFLTATLPIAPTVSATSPAPRHASVSWSGVSGADAYQLYYRVNNGSIKFYKAYTSAQSLMFSGLTSSSKITFIVRAVKKTDSGYIFGSYKTATIQVR